MAETLDPRTILERALLSESGLRVTLADYKQAVRFRHMCHRLRKRDKDESRKLYPIIDPKYDKSDFDRLVLRIHEAEPNVVWIEAEKIEVINIEEIKGDAGREETANIAGDRNEDA